MKLVFEEYNLQFLDDQTGRYANGSQAAQAMSLIVGLVPEEYQDKVAEAIKDGILTYLNGGEEGTEAVSGTEETDAVENLQQ